MGRSLDIRFKMDPEPGHGGAEGLLARYQRALERRRLWEAHWQECYEFALPQRTGLFGSPVGGKRTDRLFDGTAPDAVDQLAASLLAELTPPWTRWFGLEGGVGLDEVGRASLAPLLEDVAETLRLHFDRSTFAVELHQCFLDLVTIGTAALLFEEAPPGEISAFRFSAIPMTELTLDEGPSGRLDVVYRHAAMPLSHVRHRFPDADVPDVRPGGAMTAATRWWRFWKLPSLCRTGTGIRRCCCHRVHIGPGSGLLCCVTECFRPRRLCVSAG
ncbi:portal protein [Haematospirillum sp. 15-248]|uniref:portal protein n=1 Tax=Haematospirillum sp. 15-248 TaxID=2723107 RepID=UPI002AC32F48|nr:portal protein [Haematospirillum sp. 15-248]